MHPTQYPTNSTQVGLVKTLFIGTTRACFVPRYPILDLFYKLIKEFQAWNRDLESERTIINKFQMLWQGDPPTLTNAVDFCFLACNIPWQRDIIGSISTKALFIKSIWSSSPKDEFTQEVSNHIILELFVWGLKVLINIIVSSLMTMCFFNNKLLYAPDGDSRFWILRHCHDMSMVGDFWS